MPALTADRNTILRDNREFSFPVEAATKIFAGSIVALNAAGNATKGAVSTTLRAVGVAQELADNSGGVAGAIDVKVRRGLFRFNNSSAGDLITRANIGSNCFIVDDNTVALTNGTSTRSVAGVIRDVEAVGVWVEF
jgi:hypothetical protein